METTKTTKTATAAQSKSLDPVTGDRLSSLPDEILSHILSYLPTKHAVGTAVLSRRWKDPWTMVSNLDFDNRLVHKSRLAGIHRRDSEFCRFVDRVLAQHKSLNSLRRFRFHLSVSYCNFEPSRGFWSTMEPEFGSQLEEIDVKLESDDRFGAFRKLLPPPVSLYTLGSLRVLKLAGVAIMMSTTHDSVFLPSLEILQLLLVRTMDCESLHMLISGCPVLETVHIENCYFLDETEKKTLIAVLPCLKNLKIINYYESHCNPLSPIAVEAPSLEHLHLENSTMLPFMGGSPLSCLHSAWVDIGDRQSLLDDHRSMIRLLPQISDNAKEIYLSRKTIHLMSFLYDAHQLPVTFPKLTHLTAGSVHDFQQLPFVFPQLTHLTVETRSVYVLHSWLNSASRLQSLVAVVDQVFHMNQEIEINDEIDLEALECGEAEFPAGTPPECLLSSLEEIEIRGFSANEQEMNIIAYLLKAGAILKKMNVHMHNCVEIEGGYEDLESLLLELPRASSACEVRLLHSAISDSDSWSSNVDSHNQDNSTFTFWQQGQFNF